MSPSRTEADDRMATVPAAETPDDAPPVPTAATPVYVAPPEEEELLDLATNVRLTLDEALRFGEFLAHKGQVDQSGGIFARILELLPGNVEAHFGCAQIAMWQGRYAAAEEHFAKVAAQRPQATDVEASLAYCLRQQGKINEALAAYRRAEALMPDNAEIRFEAAMTLLFGGLPIEAAIQFQSLRNELPEATRLEAYANMLAQPQAEVAITLRDRTTRFRLSGRDPATELPLVEGNFPEQRALESLTDLVPLRSIILDVGAGLGVRSVYFAVFLAAAKVISVEANPSCSKGLQANIQANQLRGQIDTRNLGVAAGAASGQARVLGCADLAAVVLPLAPAETAPEGDITVPMRPLDRMVLEPVQLMRIDVGGMVLDVLNGAQRLISRHQPIIMVTTVSMTEASVLSHMAALGYRVRTAFRYAGDRTTWIFLSDARA